MHSSLSELLLVIFVALLVINPKRLPEIFHFLGQMTERIQKKMKQLKTRWFDETA